MAKENHVYVLFDQNVKRKMCFMCCLTKMARGPCLCAVWQNHVYVLFDQNGKKTCLCAIWPKWQENHVYVLFDQKWQETHVYLLFDRTMFMCCVITMARKPCLCVVVPNGKKTMFMCCLTKMARKNVFMCCLTKMARKPIYVLFDQNGKKNVFMWCLTKMARKPCYVLFDQNGKKNYLYAVWPQWQEKRVYVMFDQNGKKTMFMYCLTETARNQHLLACLPKSLLSHVTKKYFYNHVLAEYFVPKCNMYLYFPSALVYQTETTCRSNVLDGWIQCHINFFPFRSVTLEPLQGFRRNLTQMFTRLRRCAEAMFWMAGFKVMDWPYIQNPSSHLVPVLKPGM